MFVSTIKTTTTVQQKCISFNRMGKKSKKNKHTHTERGRKKNTFRMKKKCEAGNAKRLTLVEHCVSAIIGVREKNKQREIERNEMIWKHFIQWCIHHCKMYASVKII